MLGAVFQIPLGGVGDVVDGVLVAFSFPCGDAGGLCLDLWGDKLEGKVCSHDRGHPAERVGSVGKDSGGVGVDL